VLTLSILPSQWFEVIVNSMLEGNVLHDLLFDGEARNLDTEDAVNCCGFEMIHTPLIMIKPSGIEFDLHSGDLSLLVQSLQTQASYYQVQVAVLTMPLWTLILKYER